MAFTLTTLLLLILPLAVPVPLFIYLIYLLIRCMRAYLRSKETRTEKAHTRQSLGEALKAHRERLHMTQEFVAESLGVSRQAVSKWENGVSLR